MTCPTVGICRETSVGERRVALVPESAGPIAALGAHLVVEVGVGADAGFTDAAYAGAGADLLARDQVLDRADVLIGFGVPGCGAYDQLHRGQILIGLWRPLRNPLFIRHLADHGITTISVDLLSSTDTTGRPTDWEPMDAVASQSLISGREAALIAAGHSARPIRSSVAGKGSQPVRALVIGNGAAALQAVATLRDLGAVVEAFDTRLCVTGDLSSVRTRTTMRLALMSMIPHFDIVIATTSEAQDAEPEVLVTTEAIEAMRPGSVIIDTTVEPGVRTVELAEPSTSVTISPGVTVIGAGNLPSNVASLASEAYARRIISLLGHMMHAGSLTIDLSDPIQAAIVVTHQGNVLNDAVWRRILDATAVAGLP